jgi:hypothetical protein
MASQHRVYQSISSRSPQKTRGSKSGLQRRVAPSRKEEERLEVAQPPKHIPSMIENVARSPETAKQPATPPREFIQAKFTLGAAGDKYEQEADRMAKEVVNQINAPQLLELPHPGSIQQKAILLSDRRGWREDDETAQRKIDAFQQIWRKDWQASSANEETVGQEFEQELSHAKSSGQSLDAKIQAKMEAGFGADFSRVKVHTDEQSDRLSRSIQAKAFTTGTNIFFKQGEYNPNSRGGQELLAHELTHVVQQSGTIQAQEEPDEYSIQTKQIASTSRVVVSDGIIQRIVDSEITKLEASRDEDDYIGSKEKKVMNLLREYNEYMHLGLAPTEEQTNMLEQAIELLNLIVESDDTKKIQSSNWLYRQSVLNEIIERLYFEIDSHEEYMEIFEAEEFDQGECNTVSKVLFDDGWEAVWKSDNGNVPKRISKETGIPLEQANLGSRNIAMYRLDQLLGTGVIPRTERATYDGQAGIVMDFVEGTQLFRVEDQESISLQLDFSDKNVQKGLSNLQLLDAICGQVDRHGQNIMAVRNEDGTIGIFGIDNDLAFGVNVNLDGQKKIQNEKGIPKYTDIQTAANILSISAQDIINTLLGLLSDDEIEKTVERFLEVQNHIKEIRQMSEMYSQQEDRLRKDRGVEMGEQQENPRTRQRRGAVSLAKPTALKDRLVTEWTDDTYREQLEDAEWNLNTYRRQRGMKTENKSWSDRFSNEREMTRSYLYNSLQALDSCYESYEKGKNYSFVEI